MILSKVNEYSVASEVKEIASPTNLSPTYTFNNAFVSLAPDVLIVIFLMFLYKI